MSSGELRALKQATSVMQEAEQGNPVTVQSARCGDKTCDIAINW